jgi:formate dehydrogenase maturation protein FdhE
MLIESDLLGRLQRSFSICDVCGETPTQRVNLHNETNGARFTRCRESEKPLNSLGWKEAVHNNHPGMRLA